MSAMVVSQVPVRTAASSCVRSVRQPFGLSLPARVVARRGRTLAAPQASLNSQDVHDQVTRVASFGAAAATFLAAGNVQAAQEVAELAGDNRFGIIALLFLPALGWVGFNILQPFLNQMDAMSGNNAPAKKLAVKKRSVAAGLGLAAASLLAVQSAEAANEVAQLAGDNRTGIIALLFLPALGWVGFNILQPALNQLDAMSAGGGGKKVAIKKRAAAAGLGLTAASLLHIQAADAANEVAQLAGDNRFGIIALLFLPAIGWVGFNILQPFLNQLDAMSSEKAAPKKAGKKR